MLTNTKSLFGALLKQFGADCVCDIGSCDGAQSLFFRDLFPEARVFAFEANPLNYRTMTANEGLRAGKIEIFHLAVSSEAGTAKFHITDVDYESEEANKGTSSLLVREDLAVKETVEVTTCRLDEFMEEQYPEAKSVGLWIDVEGVEYSVLEGMKGIQERVMAIHVETAEKAMREGQKTLDELTELLASYGFEPCGTNIGSDRDWGDVVFVRSNAAREMGFDFTRAKLKGYMGYWCRADHFAVFLKKYFPPGYRFLRWLYMKVGV